MYIWLDGWVAALTETLERHEMQTNDGSMIVMVRESDLSDEAFEGGELVDGEAHLAHVVGDVGGGAAGERVGDDGVGEGLVERVQALAQRLLRLHRRLLQPVHRHDLLLRQRVHVRKHHLHPIHTPSIH